MENLKGIIFDLDGVIVTTDNCHYLAWKEMADGEGIPFDRTINERLRGVSRMQSLEIILERSPREYTEEQKIALAEKKNNIYKKPNFIANESYNYSCLLFHLTVYHNLYFYKTSLLTYYFLSLFLFCLIICQ